MPRCNATPYKLLQRVFAPFMQSYTAHAAKQRTGLYRGFSCNYARSTARDTRPTQAAIIPLAPRWSVSQRRNTSSEYQIPAPRRTLYRTAQPPYYNKVYKGAAAHRLLWIHARRCSISHTMPARRGHPGGLRSGTGQQSRCTGWHVLPGGAVQRQERGGRCGTIGGYRRNSFRAFAR